MHRQGLFNQRTSHNVVTLPDEEAASLQERPGDTHPVPQLPKYRQALLIEGTRQSKIDMPCGHIPQVMERPGDTSPISQLPPYRQTLLIERTRQSKVAMLQNDIIVGQLTQGAKRPGNA